MIISNIRSSNDLQDKRRLNDQLLELEIANEAELEKRVRDFKNPYKPAVVPPQFKSTAEMRKDKLEQERNAIKNMTEIGFDYKNGAELVAWLSSSEVDRLVDFNANFKGIKKDLQETTNPKLLTTEYLKNYLERYFEDLDVSYGRKFAQQSQREEQQNLNVEDLLNEIPNEEILNGLKNLIEEKQHQLREELNRLKLIRTDTLSSLSGDEVATELMIDVGANAPIRRIQLKNAEVKELTKRLENTQRDIKKIENYIQRGYLILNLINFYEAVIPNDDFFNTLKLSLPIQERTDLVRRYGRLFRKIKALNTEGVEELIYELSEVESIEEVFLLYGKLERAFSFMSDKSVDIISSLNRNYENVLSKEGKQVELEKIKRFNDIQEQKAQEAKENIKNFFKNPPMVDDIKDVRQDRGEDEEGLDVLFGDNKPEFVKNFVSKFSNKEYAREVETKEDPQERLRMEELQIEQSLARAEQAKRNAILKRAEETISIEKIKSLLRKKLPAIQQKVAERDVERIREERQRVLVEMDNYYNLFVQELQAVQGANARYYTYRNLLNELGITANDIRNRGINLSQRPRGEIADDFYGLILDYIAQQRRQAYEQGNLPVDYDYEGVRGRPLIQADIKDSRNENTGRTQRGLGLKKALKSHFKDDEEELMEMAKALKKHKKKEKQIDEMVSDEEMEGGNLGFKHKRIKVGRGIVAKEKKANYKNFGKYLIHVGHLIDKNIANFKYPSKASIPSIKPIPITDDYKDFLLDMLENEKPNERFLSKLSIEEQKHFEKVMRGAGLLSQFNLRKIGDEEEKNSVERFNILRGEVLAGNNNDNVIKELKTLIIKFVNDGRIRRQEGLNMLMELSVI